MGAPSLGGLAASAGFYGKLPARGDFVRAGLPRDFIEPWDAWWQGALLSSRAALGAGWAGAWLQAPIWRFALPPGLCGRGGVLGLWMPSVDRAGRYFPLTAAVVAAGPWPALAAAGGGFLAAAEAAALDAVEADLPPDALALRIEAALASPPGEPPACGPIDGGQAAWWTAGSPLVPACAFASAALPDAAAFAAMIAGAVP